MQVKVPVINASDYWAVNTSFSMVFSLQDGSFNAYVMQLESTSFGEVRFFLFSLLYFFSLLTFYSQGDYGGVVDDDGYLPSVPFLLRSFRKARGLCCKAIQESPPQVRQTNLFQILTPRITNCQQAKYSKNFRACDLGANLQRDTPPALSPFVYIVSFP